MVSIQTYLFSSLATLILGGSFWVTKSHHFVKAPDLISAIVAMGLAILLPTLFHLLVQKPRKIPTVTVFLVFAAGIFASHQAIPSEHQEVLRAIEIFSAFVELTITGIAIYNLRKWVKLYREFRRSGMDFSQAIRKAAVQYIPSKLVANLFATEITLLRYGLLSWRDKIPQPDNIRTFSIHQNSGWTGILFFIFIIGAAEGIGIHFLLRESSPTLNILHAFLCIYGMIWLIGDYQAIRSHLIILSDPIRVSVGFRYSAVIPLNLIKKIERGIAPEPEEEIKKGKFVNYSIPGYHELTLMGDAQALIHLKQPITVNGALGGEHHVSLIGISPDNLDVFLKRAEILLNEKTETTPKG